MPAIQRRAEDLLLEIRLRSRDLLRSHPDLAFDSLGAEVEQTSAATLTFSSLEFSLALEVRAGSSLSPTPVV